MTIPTLVLRLERRQSLSGKALHAGQRRPDAATPEEGLHPVIDLLDHDTGTALLDAARCFAGKDGWHDPPALRKAAATLLGHNLDGALLDAARTSLGDGRQEQRPAGLLEALRLLSGEGHPDAAALRVDLARRLVACKLAERKAAGARGPTPAGYADVLAGGPPRYGAPGAWPAQRVLAFGRATLDFARTSFPSSFLVQAHVHQDGAGPSIRLTLVPVGSTGRLGWNAVSRDLSGHNHIAGMRALLDRFHADVAGRFGLARGGRSPRSRGEERYRR